MCEILKLVDEEYDRYKQGMPSCLDPTNWACDWNPSDATDSIVETLEASQFLGRNQEKALSECLRWTGGDVSVLANAASRKDLSTFDQSLTAYVTWAKGALAAVPSRAPKVAGEQAADGR